MNSEVQNQDLPMLTEMVAHYQKIKDPSLLVHGCWYWARYKDLSTDFYPKLWPLHGQNAEQFCLEQEIYGPIPKPALDT